MEREHCTSGDSKGTFSPGNYDTTTTPEAEWRVVRDPGEGRRVSAGLRLVKALAELRKVKEVEEAELLDEEILALLLYTGPMYSKYNAVLRGFPQEVVDGLKDNNYATTIHLIVSGVIKLSRCMVLPKDRVVYRGLEDLGLPEEFLTADRYGVRGGLELGLMSTSEDRRVAIQYAGTRMPTVFEIGVGAVDRGASLKFLSQYPGEDEILFPPMSYLEVTGETRMEAGPGGKTTRVVSLSVNANQTCGTIEAMLGLRRQLHVKMLENFQMEIKGELEVKLDSEEVKGRLACDAFAKDEAHHKKMVDTILKEDDGQYERAIKEAVQLKKMALGKFQHWMEGADARDLEKQPMLVVRRHAVAELHRRRMSKEAQGRGSGGQGSAEALILCKELGLFVRSLDETNEDGEPPLVAAGSGGNVWALQLLLAAGCEVGAASEGWTALHWASLLGHIESVACLVEAGADLYAKTVGGETCLTVAAGAGQSEVVGYLAKRGGEGLVLAVDSLGRSAAFMAADQGRVGALRMLIDAGGKELLMLVDTEGRSCAYVAARNGQMEALGMLIEAGGTELLMLTNRSGVSCAYMASQNGHAKVLKVLIEAGGKELLELVNTNGASCAHISAREGHSEALGMLVEVGGKELLMRVEKDGASCAYVASSEGHAEALRILIEVGGKELLMLVNKKGASCAYVASQYGHTKVLRMLIEAGGTELLMLTNQGSSCAHVAAQKGQTEALGMLIEAGGKKLLMLENRSGVSCA
ncbi:ankyrin repeat-containing domain protein, partial [Baffinella frigidus]